MKIMGERHALEPVADQYRQEGYTVVLRPTGSTLPGFLAGFEPDMIARKNGEGVVVQVTLKEELRTEPELSHLVGVVNAEPGWRFDLVVLNPKKWPDDVASAAAEPTDADIHRLIHEASNLVHLQVPRAAFVTAWAAVEAAMREVARKQSIPLERNSPRFVLNTLYSEGVLSRADAERLQESLELRNAAIHGLQPGALSPGHTEFLLELAKQLLELKSATAQS